MVVLFFRLSLVRRESGVTSVLRSKTLAQAESTSAEHMKSARVPAAAMPQWDVEKGVETV